MFCWRPGSMWYLWCCYGDEDQGVCDIYDVAMMMKTREYVIFMISLWWPGRGYMWYLMLVMKTKENVIFMILLWWWRTESMWYLMLLWWCRPLSMWYLWCCYGDEDQGVCDIYDVAMVMKTREYVIFMMLPWWWKSGSMWYLRCCYGDQEEEISAIYKVAMAITQPRRSWGHCILKKMLQVKIWSELDL